MPADSGVRKLAKRALSPLLPERGYRLIQALTVARDIRAGRSFDEPELELIPLAVRPGETTLDIGANYGAYAYHLARASGPEGRVYAFEPIPFTVSTLALVQKLLRLRNVEIVPKGCSDRSGTVTFTVPVQDSGAISAGQAHFGDRDDDRAGKQRHVRHERSRQVTCEVVALDAFLPDVSEISLIKCDIEGAEVVAFKGATRLIERHLPTVICEINPWFLEGFSTHTEDLTRFFRDRGYHIYSYRVDGDRRLVEVADDQDIIEDNYVFIHPRRRQRFARLLEGVSVKRPR